MKWDEPLLKRWVPGREAEATVSVLEFLLNFVFGTGALVTTFNLLLDPQLVGVSMGLVLMIAIFGLRILMQFGRVRLAGFGLLVTLWLVIGGSVLISGGLRSPLVVALLAVPGVALVLNGWGSALLAFVFCLAPLFARPWIDTWSGIDLPNLIYHPLSWLLLVAGLGGVAFWLRRKVAALARSAPRAAKIPLPVGAEEASPPDSGQAAFADEPAIDSGDLLDDAAGARSDVVREHAAGILRLNAAGQIIAVNEHAARLLGYSDGELIGRRPADLLPEADRLDFQRWLAALLERSEAGISERPFQRKNGSLLSVELSAGLLADNEGSAPALLLIRDITERKRADLELVDLLSNLRERTKQIQTAFEVSKSISSTLDLRNLLNQTVEIIKQRFSFYYVGLYLLENEEAILVAGSGEQGKQLIAAGHRLPVAPSSMVGWCIENRRARIASDVGRDAVHAFNPVVPKTRSEMTLPLIIHGQPIGALTVQSEYLSAFGGEDVAVLQIMADQLAVAVQNARLHQQLTAYAGELEERVRERTAQLEAVNHELESFSYSISHDLRTPLRAVHGYSNIALDEFSGQLPPEAAVYLEKIRANALRMGELIDDILAFSRMGRKELHKSLCQPNLLVREVLEDQQTELAARQVMVRIDPLPPALADASLLKQVFANLISNAVKFTRHSESPQIEIGFGSTDEGLAFFVRDNGVGFDPKFGDRIFGVFQRLHRDDEFEGTGVGLAIVHRIIERHGGRVWFDAREGEGAVFYFSLPDGNSPLPEVG